MASSASRTSAAAIAMRPAAGEAVGAIGAALGRVLLLLLQGAGGGARDLVAHAARGLRQRRDGGRILVGREGHDGPHAGVQRGDDDAERDAGAKHSRAQRLSASTALPDSLPSSGAAVASTTAVAAARASSKATPSAATGSCIARATRSISAARRLRTRASAAVSAENDPAPERHAHGVR